MKNNLLYHYTNIESFNAIYRSGVVWASDCRYLNDRYEFHRAREIFLNSFNAQDRDALKYAFIVYGLRKFHCVFSLSKSPKVLNQWRAYADDGKGVAIGLHAESIVGYKKYPAASLVECIYEGQEDFITKLKETYSHEISDILGRHEEILGMSSNKPDCEAIEAAEKNYEPIEKIICELLRVKNSAFSEEQESRLILNTSAKDAKTRASNGLIVPYVEHDLFPYEDDLFSSISFVMCEVWFGPKCDERNFEVLSSMGHLGWHVGHGLMRYDCGYV